MPDDRFIDGVDQTSFLLAPDGPSNRKYLYYWLLRDVLGACASASTSSCSRRPRDDDTDVAGPGGFTGVTQNYTYARLYNLYLDPKEQHSYLIRKLAYIEAFMSGIREHLAHVPGPPAEEHRLGAGPSVSPGRRGPRVPRRGAGPRTW